MTTTTATLAEFLLARVEEDEAQFAVADRMNIVRMHGSRMYSGVGNRPTVTDGRLRAECEAVRRIVALHYREVDQWDPECDGSTDQEGTRFPWWPCETLRILGAVWADHEDYRSEWAV